METDILRIFAETAHGGSFAAVARARGVDPTSISRTVAQLEIQLGVRLFQRSTRSMRLTEAGEQFLAKAEPLLVELDKALDEAKNLSATPSGTLRLTASSTFGHECIVPLLPAFRQRYPSIKLDCLLIDETLDLHANRIDLAVRLAPAVSGDLMVTKLVKTRYRIVASNAYLLTAAALKRPADLAAHDCLLFPLRDFRSGWLFKDRNGKISEVAIHGEVTLSTAQALRDAAIAGMGPSLLPDWLVNQALADQRLTDVFPDYEVTATTFETAAWLVYPSRAYLPNKVRVMIDFLKEQLR